MVTNLLGRWVTIGETALLPDLRGKSGSIVGVDGDVNGIWLLIEIAETGKLESVKADRCTVSPVEQRT